MSTTASAPGKIILLGEHAVVYGQPALAVPVRDVRATATVRGAPSGSGLIIEALDLNARMSLAQAATDALVLTAKLVLERLGAPEPDGVIEVRSSIPVASGLGSGAAVSAALARALAEYLGAPLGNVELSALVYEVEKTHHGTPSGIDNTVVCYDQPVFFIRDKALEPFQPAAPFHILIGDTGIASPTRITVGSVREGWLRERDAFERLFAEIGARVLKARNAIESGRLEALGPLMSENQFLLEQMGVSSPELERLIKAARAAGAEGAKLSGGGGGGNMIALVPKHNVESVRTALIEAGAVRVLHTIIE
jgi:mevalonate kinase